MTPGGAGRQCRRRSAALSRPGARPRSPSAELGSPPRRHRPEGCAGRHNPPASASGSPPGRRPGHASRRSARVPAWSTPERERTFATPTYLSPIPLRSIPRGMGERYVQVVDHGRRRGPPPGTFRSGTGRRAPGAPGRARGERPMIASGIGTPSLPDSAHA